MSMKVTILRKVEVTDFSGEKVMADFETGKYLMLKGAGNDIWEMLRDGITVDEIVSALMNVYEISESECTKSTVIFLEKLRDLGFISLA